jgi:hypothetical protein
MKAYDVIETDGKEEEYEDRHDDYTNYPIKVHHIRQMRRLDYQKNISTTINEHVVIQIGLYIEIEMTEL